MESEYKEVFDIPLDQLDFDVSLNPRKETLEEDLEALATSIKHVGQITPIKVIKRGKRWVVVDGQRRVLAIRLLQEQGLDSFKIVKAINISQSTRNLFFDNLIDLVFRANINYADRARAVVKLLDQEKLNPVELANAFGKSVEWVNENVKVAKMAELTNKEQLEKIDKDTVVKIQGLPIDDDVKVQLIQELPSVPPSVRTKAINILKKRPRVEKKDIPAIIAEARSTKGGGILKIKIPIRQTTYDKAMLCKPAKLSVEDYLGYMLDLGAGSWQTAMLLES